MSTPLRGTESTILMLAAYRGWIFLSVSWLLFGCSEYQIARPTTKEGIACASACDQSRAKCEHIAEAEASLETSWCDSVNEAGAAPTCTPTGSDSVGHCPVVPSAPVCVSPSPKVGSCISDWELCVLSCGGRMTNSRAIR